MSDSSELEGEELELPESPSSPSGAGVAVDLVFEDDLEVEAFDLDLDLDLDFERFFPRDSVSVVSGPEDSMLSRKSMRDAALAMTSSCISIVR